MHLESYLRTLAGASRPVQLEILDHLRKNAGRESPPNERTQTTGSGRKRCRRGNRTYMIQDQSMDGLQITLEHQVETQQITGARNSDLPIAKEALTNAKKHSGSPRIEVVLKDCGNRIKLDVRDWGSGFTSRQVFQCLITDSVESVNESGCWVARSLLDSQLGKGTTTRLICPLSSGRLAPRSARRLPGEHRVNGCRHNRMFAESTGLARRVAR